MAEGVPAIAPCHTAMSSFINQDNVFLADSSIVVTCWPQDPLEYERCFFYRIDWQSLRDCYEHSADVDERRYREMRFNAASLVRQNYSLLAVGELLRDYLGRLDNQ